MGKGPNIPEPVPHDECSWKKVHNQENGGKPVFLPNKQ